MTHTIRQSIDNLEKGQEITIILNDGRMMSGLYGGMDEDNVILRCENEQVPSIGWSIDSIKEIICGSLVPAGDIVQVDIIDVKTRRKVAITIDHSGEEGTCNIEFIPGINSNENGLYVNLALRFVKMITE